MAGTINTIHVLHVDDDPDFADLAGTFLEREDDRFEVDTATSASEGLDRLETSMYDCVVSDHDMPGKNGIEFLKAVREGHPDLPFILYTGKGSEEVASSAISAGVTEYLQKEGGTSQYAVLSNRIRNAVEKYHAQTELADREKRLNLFFERSPLGVVEWDENFDFVQVNDAAEQILGYSEDTLVGRSWHVIVPESDREPVDEVVSELLENTGGYLSVNTNVREDGERIVCEWHNRVVTDDSGDVVAIFSQFQDITEENERKAELQRSDRRYEAIFNDPNILVGLLETDGTVIDVNETAMEYVDADLADITGEPFWETPWFTGDETIQQEVREWIEQAATGEYVEFEIDLSGSVGDQLVVTGVFRPVRNDDGDVVSLLISDRDITERREHEQKRRQIIDRMNDAVIEVDPEWRITLVNERTEDLSGLDGSRLLGRDFWDVFSDARGTHFEDEYRGAMETRESVSIVGYYSGVEEWFDVTVYPNSDGGLAFYFRRITQYKEREQRLEQYEKIVDTMDDVAFVVDDEWIVDLTNESISEYINVSFDSLEGQPVMRLAEEYIADEDGPARFEQALERAFQEENPSGAPERLELTLDTDSGQVVFEYQFSPLVTDGETRAIVITMRDITGRKRYIEKLQALNERSRMLMTAGTSEQITEVGVEAARDILELDASAIHLYDAEQSGLVPVAVTDTTYDLVGEPPVFTTGDGIAWRAYEQGEALSFDDVLDEPDIYNPETPIRSELHLPLGDHGILLAGSPTPNAFDEHDFVLGRILAANIASALDQVTQTESLRAREAELTRQNEQLEEFASIVSHDLRNPLNVAEGRLELVAEECDSEHLEHVEHALDRMVALIEDLLTLAREDEVVTDFEWIDLTALAEGCWANVETEDATLVTTLERTIRADESRLRQVFENLLRNAVEHGGDDVTVTIGELDDGFYVEDDGSGISEDERDDVFDAGYSTNEEGTGFGLSIVKQVVDSHDWEIRVIEGSEGGARFEITGVEFTAE